MGFLITGVPRIICKPKKRQIASQAGRVPCDRKNYYTIINMTNKKTDEFLFILKPSPIEGVGVFTATKIKKGPQLRLFQNSEKIRFIAYTSATAKQHGKLLKRYCVESTKGYFCPDDFGRMSIGWYLNHSKRPNAFHKNYTYYTKRDIEKDKEITIDYSTLDS